MGRGALVQTAIVQGTTWGTPVAAGAASKIRCRSYRFARAGREILPDDTLAGKAWGNVHQVGAHLTEVELRGIWRYGYRLPYLAATIFGTSGSPSGGGPYVHTLTLADALTKFSTLVAREPSNASTTAFREVASVMAEELVLRASRGAPGEFEWRGIGGKLDESGSSTNDGTSWANVTETDSDAFVLGTDGRCRINAQAGAGLGSSDVVKPTAIEIRILRPLLRDHRLDADLAGLIAQPTEDGEPMVTLALEFAHRGAASSYMSAVEDWNDAFNAGTAYKADLLFTKSSNNKWQFDFPYIVLAEQPILDVDGAGVTRHRLLFRCFAASSAPTGMTATQPIEGYITDQLSGAYLS